MDRRREMKKLPYGIFWLPPVSSTKNYNDPTQWAVWANPLSLHITGVVARCSWELIEPVEGTYNWEYIDSIKAAAHAGGFYWELAIMCNQGSNAAYPFYPSWVQGDGAALVTIHDNSGTAVTNLASWDPVFQAKWGAFLVALAARYDDNDAWLSAVQMTGPGRQGELYDC